MYLLSYSYNARACIGVMAGFSGGAQQSEVNQGNQGLGNKRHDSGLLLESLVILAVLIYPKQ